jgi:hypothetical protein
MHDCLTISCTRVFVCLAGWRHVCRGVCCQFDFPRMSSSHPYKGCPWGVNPQPITPSNVAERSAKLLDQYRKKATLYRTRHVLAPIGNDFEFMRAEYAENQFKNYQAIFDHMNSNPSMNVHARFATLHEYFHDVTKFVEEHPAEPAATAVPGAPPYLALALRPFLSPNGVCVRLVAVDLGCCLLFVLHMPVAKTFSHHDTGRCCCCRCRCRLYYCAWRSREG